MSPERYAEVKARMEEQDKETAAKSKAAWERATQAEKDTAKRVALLCARLVCTSCSNRYPIVFVEAEDGDCYHRDPNYSNLPADRQLTKCRARAIQYLLAEMDNPECEYHHMLYED